MGFSTINLCGRACRWTVDIHKEDQGSQGSCVSSKGNKVLRMFIRLIAGHESWDMLGHMHRGQATEHH